MADLDQCCITSCCNENTCKSCESIDENCGSCCADPSTPSKLKTKEQAKREEMRMEFWMRTGVRVGFAFAFIAILTQPHYLWQNYFLFAIFWVLFILSSVTYEKLRLSYPGFIPLDDIQAFHKRQVSKMERKAAAAVQDFERYASSVKLDSSASSSGNEGLKAKKRSRKNANIEEDVIMSPIEHSNASQITFEIEDPYENTIVLRYRFCKKCDKYIARYDHHCYWLGTCIGEKNHVLFVTFLSLVSAFIFYAWLVSLSAMYYSHYDIVFQFSWAKLFFNILVVWIAFFVSMFVFFLPFCLLCHHIYLIATNQTSYEVYRPSKLDYFKNVPDNAAKFDEGFVRNCTRFWTDLNPFINPMRDADYLKYKISRTPTNSVMTSFDDWCDRLATKCCC